MGITMASRVRIATLIKVSNFYLIWSGSCHLDLLGPLVGSAVCLGDKGIQNFHLGRYIVRFCFIASRW